MKRIFILGFIFVALSLLSVNAVAQRRGGGNGGANFSTGGSIDVEYTSATLIGLINKKRIRNLTEYGVVISKNKDVEDGNYVPADSTKNNRFSVWLGGLEIGARYYYATYIRHDGFCSYGAVKSFSTKGLTKGEYVDLGLKSRTLWATKNIGAEKPEEYGLYFQWGDTKGYTSNTDGEKLFDSKHCKYFDAKGLPSKYCENDGKTELDFEDDAAYVNWGPNWRMPSVEQFRELFNSPNTKYYGASLNNVSGYIIISKNGNSIFIPCAGRHLRGGFQDGGWFGYYWSRTASSGAYYANILDTQGSLHPNSYSERFNGFSVRPVRR